DPVHLVAEHSRDEVRAHAHTPATAPVVLYIGRLSNEKRPDRLLRVFSTVRTSVPEARLWLIGDGPSRASIEQQVAAAGLHDAVTLFGTQANVAEWIQAADLLVLTSDTEGIPGAILEAATLGVPAVATAVGGVAECVIDGESGVLRSPDDEAGLADAVVGLLADEARRRRLGGRARRLVQDSFALDSVASLYVDFYESVLAGVRATRRQAEARP